MHTFVIPVYKESPYLEECIQSLVNQTVKSTVVITTSTPTTYSKQLADKYGLDYFISDKKGIASDWNFALSKANTPLVTIAHQDDIYHPGYTQNIIKATKKNTLITFTGYQDLINNKIRPASLNSFVKNALLFPFAFKKNISSIHIKKSVLIFGDPICCPSVTFNSEALPGFGFSTAFTCVLDWYAWYKLAGQKGAFSFVNKKLVKHRIHPGSETMVQLTAGIRRQEELQMFKMIWGGKAAAVISWLYTLGHAGNKLQRSVIFNLEQIVTGVKYQPIETDKPLPAMLALTFALVIVYCLSTAFSIVLLGDRSLISGNLYELKNIILLVFNWKFILSMSLAVLSRVSFILINNTLLKIPYLAGISTTLSVFITLTSIIFILLANHFFLNETLNLKQAIGAFIILTGIFIMLNK